MSTIGPIDYDKDYNRYYIPLPGGWEVQTKGRGSTFRVAGPGCDKPGSSVDRLAIPDQPYLHETIERMARDIHAACSTPTAQPAQADEAVAWREIRPDGTPVSSEGCYYPSPPPTGRILDYIYEKGGRVEYVYARPQPEQPASAVDDDEMDGRCSTCNGLGLANVIDPSDGALVMDDCPECGGESYTQSPAASLPGVVAVSDEDVEGMAACLSDDAAYLRSVRDADFTDVADNMERASAALESFASRMGSGERRHE